MSNNECGNGASAFKQAQTRHRRQGAAPNRVDDLDSVLDFSRPRHNDYIYSLKPPSQKETYKGPLYGVTEYPGFLYGPKAVGFELQTELAFAAVSEYCEAPHATNIDLVPPKSGKEENNANESMWELWKEQNGYGTSNGEANGQPSIKKYRSFSKLSWATMGYQYDWTARAYHEGAKSPVPPLLKELASLFARTSLSLSNESSTDFSPSACIVNYYTEKSTMGGHRDDLELALDKPVISISLGLPAVFLLGGKTKDDVPVIPILVRPGDVMILGGDSRLCYHGMARVLPAEVTLLTMSETLPSQQSFQLTRESVFSSRIESGDASFSEATVPESDQAALANYLKKNRININVRQVLPDGMNELPERTSDK